MEPRTNQEIESEIDQTPKEWRKIYRKGPFQGQTKRFAKYIHSKTLLNEHQAQYRKIVVSIKKQYKISQFNPNLSAELMIDEAAMTTLRIQQLEHYQHFLFLTKSEPSDYLENILVKCKDQRRKALETIRFLCGGGAKSARGQITGQLSYRDKLNRSKKLQQVQKVEKTLRGLRSRDFTKIRETSESESEDQASEETPEAEYSNEAEVGERTGGDF